MFLSPVIWLVQPLSNIQLNHRSSPTKQIRFLFYVPKIDLGPWGLVTWAFCTNTLLIIFFFFRCQYISQQYFHLCPNNTCSHLDKSLICALVACELQLDLPCFLVHSQVWPFPWKRLGLVLKSIVDDIPSICSRFVFVVTNSIHDGRMPQWHVYGSLRYSLTLDIILEKNVQYLNFLILLI